MRDSAAKAASWALPRALEGVGNALNLSERKDTEGGALSKKLWMPRTPTVKDRRTRFYRHEEPEMFERNDQYCDQDVIAEQAVSHATPELHPFEQKVYEHDLQVAERGIHIDINAVDNAIEVFHQAEQKYAPELVQITGGAVNTANSHAALKKWLHANGAPIPNTQADTVDEWVSDSSLLLEPHVHRVLVIRQMLGSASVKKLFAMKRCRMPDGRARGALKFCGASTGRWAGSLFQPHNFPNSGPEMVRCTCGTSYCEDVAACPSCGQSVHKCRDCGSGVPRTEKKCGCGRKVGADEWTYEDMLEALGRFNTRSLEIIEAYYGNASKVIAGCLRGMLCAGPGKDLICSDYSAIEARVIAAIARENWRLDAFRDGKDIYLESASQMLHTPYETYTQYKKENDAHHPHRKKGKVGELACLAPETLVLTPRGYVRLIDITDNDLLWDGVEWIPHSGVIYKGVREVLCLDGALMTADHMVNCKNSWKEAKQLALNLNTLKLSLVTGSESLPLSRLVEPRKNSARLCSVRAERPLILSLTPIYTGESLRDAGSAGERNLGKRATNTILGTSSTAQIPNTDADLLIGSEQLSRDATALIACRTKTTELEVSEFVTNGAKSSELEHSCNMSRLLKGGGR